MFSIKLPITEQLQSFLKFTNFYWQIIRGFSLAVEHCRAIPDLDISSESSTFSMHSNWTLSRQGGFFSSRLLDFISPTDPAWRTCPKLPKMTPSPDSFPPLPLHQPWSPFCLPTRSQEESISAALPGEPAPPESPASCLYVPVHLVQHALWWPSIFQDVQEFVAACDISTGAISLNQLSPGFFPLPVPWHPWLHIGLWDQPTTFGWDGHHTYHRWPLLQGSALGGFVWTPLC